MPQPDFNFENNRYSRASYATTCFNVIIWGVRSVKIRTVELRSAIDALVHICARGPLGKNQRHRRCDCLLLPRHALHLSNHYHVSIGNARRSLARNCTLHVDRTGSAKNQLMTRISAMSRQGSYSLITIVLSVFFDSAHAGCADNFLAPPGYFCMGSTTVACPVGSFCLGGVFPPTDCVPSFGCPITGLSSAPTCNWTVGTTAGGTLGAGSQDGIGTQATFTNTRALAYDGASTIYIADGGNNLVRALNLSSMQVTTVAGQRGGSGRADGACSAAQFNSPWGIAFVGGAVIVADSHNNNLRNISGFGGTGASCSVSTYAGSPVGNSGVAGSGVGTNALFHTINAVTVGPDGLMYVADTLNNQVRSVTFPGAVVSVVAGTGAQGYVEGNALSSAQLNYPYGLAVWGNRSQAVIVVAGERDAWELDLRFRTNHNRVFTLDWGNNAIRVVTVNGSCECTPGQEGRRGWAVVGGWGADG